ncbi:glycosyltransferase family 2 protein [Candidatus Roizmanbacteria bacterium]|nr:glycosyltransferase family 2 protein [Candidatus Roizmanbacteria bacterium]
MKLSLCIATFNEEKNIHYPLDSALDIVDEIIVVDGGSTDKTVEVAKSYGRKVKVIGSENLVMFHKNKQKAIETAKGEWILQLDADEELTKELKEEIKNIVGNDPRVVPNNGFWIPRKNWFLSRFLMKGGQYPDYTIRLYRNGYARFPCKDVHENVEIKGEIGYLKNPILHYADPDFSRYLMRWDRYTTAEVRVLRAKPLHFFNYFFWKPFSTFFLMYFRHKGFMDGFPGFVFALFSSIRFWVIYIKWRARKLT